MKQELLKKALKLGFKSDIIGNTVNAKFSSKNFYYLWLCELQKWIYETFRYWVDIHRIGLKFRVGIECMNTGNSIWSSDTDYNEPEEALEIGLFQALNLIS